MATHDRTAASTFDRVANDLAHQAFPDLAVALRVRTDRILKNWRNLSLNAMPHLNALTLEEFENSIAIILSAAANALQSATPEQLRGVLESGPLHGVARFVQQHSLLDLFEEVRILRGVVILELENQLERAMKVAEAATFHAIFDIIIQQGVLAMVEEQNGERQQSQSTMRGLNEQLMVGMVRQNELLEQANKAEEALADELRRKDEFLAMLSHELRNPLAPIRSATHLLRLQAPGSENLIAKQAREVIERQVASLTRLISDLLEVSRISNSRIRLNRETIDLCQAVRQALETAAPFLSRQNYELTTQVPDSDAEPVWVNADPTRVEQVIVNLLSNAAKFTDKGGKIDVSLKRELNHAVLRVRDSGIGIAPEMLPHIFDLFAQADRSLDRSQGGLGVGLSIVHKLVEMNGGTVEARSEGIGKGAEFVVRLPLVAAPGEQPSPPAAAIEQPRKHTMRVLVIDDNVDGCVMLANLLRLKEYGVQMAHNGPDALAVTKTWRPDVVLLDIGLPQLDGYEVARRLRADPALKNMKLVATTGYGNEKDLQLAREAGFDAHLIKPIDLADVEKLLGKWN